MDLGAPVIRIFAGDVQKGTTEEQARGWCVEAIRRCREYAGQRGVILALENHGGVVTSAEQLLAVVRAVDSEWFGVNLDTGNFRGEDAYSELERAVPYAVTVQVKTQIGSAQGPRPADLSRVRNSFWNESVLESQGVQGEPPRGASTDARIRHAGSGRRLRANSPRA